MAQNFDGENTDKFLAIRQNFIIQSFLPIVVCMYVSVLQFVKILLVKFFLTPNSSKISTVKILRHTVLAMTWHLLAIASYTAHHYNKLVTYYSS